MPLAKPSSRWSHAPGGRHANWSLQARDVRNCGVSAICHERPRGSCRKATCGAAFRPGLSPTHTRRSRCGKGDQGGALRAPRAGACARPLPWEARPARAGPTARTPLINRLTRRHTRRLRRGVRPGLRRVHPQAPGHPARCLPRGNEGGFPLTLAHSPTRGIVGSSTIGIGVSTSTAWKSSCRHGAKTVASTVPLARIRI